jgi:hypothetical protein
MNHEEPKDLVPEQALTAALRALAETERHREAPAHVEAALLKAFHRRHSLQPCAATTGRWRAWGVAAAAALVFAAVMLSRSQPVVVHQREVASEFIPLPNGLASLPMESGHLMRVRMPRSALVWAGLPVNGERMTESIQADVIFGEDGVPRAIRFVNRPIQLSSRGR